MRRVVIETGVARHAEGSCLITVGDTRVLCTATIEDRPPPFLKGTGLGWVTAEYGMLPRATHTRTRREAATGKQQGRTVEIQRLVGRALRAGVDRAALGERQIVIDCDVIQADGGTRCAAITGGWVALRLAMDRLLAARVISADPLVDHVAAVSCGLYGGQPVLDLDYAEDSAAEVDGNFVMRGTGALVEVQMSAEGAVFGRAELDAMLGLAGQGIGLLVAAQAAAVRG
jgi:ribonuclease PH